MKTHNKDKKNHISLNQPPENSNPGVVTHQQWQFSVPLHHPDILKKFSEIDPKYPERILTMVEIEQIHKHALENEELRQNSGKINKIFFEH